MSSVDFQKLEKPQGCRTPVFGEEAGSGAPQYLDAVQVVDE